jgi:hypothetical protein
MPRESTNFLIESAVYRTDDASERRLRELKNRINDPDPKLRITQGQYDLIEGYKTEFAETTGKQTIDPERAKSAWNKAKQGAFQQADTVGDQRVTEVIQTIVRSDPPTLEAALKQVDDRGRLKKFSDAVIAQVKQFFRDQFDQNLYAVNPRLRRAMRLEPPNFPIEGPFPEGDLTPTPRPFQPAVSQAPSDVGASTLAEPFEQGAYKGQTAPQVLAQFVPAVERDQLRARTLIAQGADPDRLTPDEIRAVKRNLHPDTKSIKVTKRAEAPLFGKRVPPGETVTRLHETPDVFGTSKPRAAPWSKEVSMNRSGARLPPASTGTTAISPPPIPAGSPPIRSDANARSVSIPTSSANSRLRSTSCTRCSSGYRARCCWPIPSPPGPTPCAASRAT